MCQEIKQINNNKREKEILDGERSGCLQRLFGKCHFTSSKLMICLSKVKSKFSLRFVSWNFVHFYRYYFNQWNTTVPMNYIHHRNSIGTIIMAAVILTRIFRWLSFHTKNYFPWKRKREQKRISWYISSPDSAHTTIFWTAAAAASVVVVVCISVLFHSS